MPDEEPYAEEGPIGRPLPPEDRLWRHPSEVAWSDSRSASGSGGSRVWAVALTSGLTGAVLAIGVVALVSGLGRVTERVVERVPAVDPLVDVTNASRQTGVPAVATSVSPSVVRLDVEREDGEATGSGVVLRDDGTLLTNAHVVAGARRITVVLHDGTGVAGHVVGADVLTDVAVVAVDEAGADWVPAVLGTAANLQVGEPAIAIGSPLGLAGGPSVTVGVVSALGRRVSADGVVLHGLIQTDAPIAEGSSGGALCDGSGVVVGITTALAGGEGLGFAIPVEIARQVAEELLGEGDVDHAWLGIEGTDLSPTEASVPGIAGMGGVVVVDVAADGPAAVAGIAVGDVVLSVDEHRVASMSDLVSALRGHHPGEAVGLTLRRDGEVVVVEVVLGER